MGRLFFSIFFSKSWTGRIIALALFLVVVDNRMPFGLFDRHAPPGYIRTPSYKAPSSKAISKITPYPRPPSYKKLFDGSPTEVLPTATPTATPYTKLFDGSSTEVLPTATPTEHPLKHPSIDDDPAEEFFSCLERTGQPMYVFGDAMLDIVADMDLQDAAVAETENDPTDKALRDAEEQAWQTAIANFRVSRKTVAETEVPTCLLDFEDESAEELKLPGSLTPEDLPKFMNGVIAVKEALLIYMDKFLECHEIGTVEACDPSDEYEALLAAGNEVEAVVNKIE